VSEGRQGEQEPDWDTTVSMSTASDETQTYVPDEDPTTIVDDDANSGEPDPTVIVGDGDAADPTVIVEDAEAGDPTVIVEEGAGVDRTVILDEEESTRVVRPASGEVADAIATTGSTSLGAPTPVEPAESTNPPVRHVMSMPVKRRRGPLRPAPVPSGFGGTVVAGRGVGARTSRPIRSMGVPPPPPAPAIEPPVRAFGRVPSVAARSHRAAVAAVAALAVVTLAGASGLTWSLINLAGL